MAFYHIQMLEQTSKITIFTETPTASGNKSQGLCAWVSDSKFRSLPLYSTVLSLCAICCWTMEMPAFLAQSSPVMAVVWFPREFCCGEILRRGSMTLHFQVPGVTRAAGLWPGFLSQGFRRPELKANLMLILGGKSFNTTPQKKTPVV